MPKKISKLLNLSINKHLLGVILAIILIGITVLITNNVAFLNLSNFIVPDGVAYLYYLEKIQEGFTILQVAQAQFPGIPNSALLWYFYSPIFQYFGAVGTFLANLLIIFIISKNINPKALIFVPYFLISAVLPSKDLLVLASSILLVNALIKNKILISLLISLAIFFIRDGAGVVAIGMVFAYLIYRHGGIGRKKLVIFALLLAFLLNEIVSMLFIGSFIYDRNYEVALIHGNPFANTGTIMDFPIRLFANATNLAFRQPFIDVDGNLAIYPLSLYISGVTNFAVLLCSIKVLFLKKITDNAYISILLYVTSLLIVSFNPFVGPRYQLPMTVITLSYIICSNIYKKIFYKFFWISLITSMLIVPIYILTIGYPAPSSGGPTLNELFK